MAAQRGKALLLKIDISGTMTTVGGMRSTSMTLNDEAVDITNKDSGSFRELLPSGGIQSMTITASGVFTDSTAEQTLRSAYGTSSFKSYNVIVPDLGTYAGTFMIASLEYAGEYNGEATYSVTLESSGSITFSAA
jgi:TP901-1 family phage major tail protein|tara:strand:+ start:346 stop:750 length:405 start_codon:yes stop_codon:yes gene_type:complete